MSKLNQIIVVPHSHTDLGFTHDAPIVDELHARFLDQAMDLCEQFADAPIGQRFCWTVEVCGVLEHWLHTATPAKIQRLQRLHAAGLVEICAMRWHLTPLTEGRELPQTLDLMQRLRHDYDLHITSAMNSDVNGQNWPLVEALLDAGINGFSMAINTHTGRAPLNRPNLFLWQGASGRKIPAFNGFPYGYDGKMSMRGHDIAPFRDKWLPRLLAQLDANNYPADTLMVQSVASFGDNGPAETDVRDFVLAWHHAGLLPKVRLGTPRDFWQAVADANLPVYRGDWTDSWNFGCLSRAREAAIQRATRARIQSTTQLLAALPPQTAATILPALTQAANAYHRYHEHTWSADCAVEWPNSEDTWTQSIHKSALAAQARSLSIMAQRDALAESTLRLNTPRPDDIVVFNTLPFDRIITGMVPGGVSNPRGLATDPTASRHFQDRKIDFDLTRFEVPPPNEWHHDPEYMLRPVRVPANSHVVLSRQEALLDPFADTSTSADLIVENTRHRLVFDLARGGVAQWFDKRLGRQIVAPHPMAALAGYVHERVDTKAPWPRSELYVMDWKADALEAPAGWKPNWPAARTPAGPVRSHRVRTSPLGIEVRQHIPAPGCIGEMELTILLPAYADWVEFRSNWTCGTDTHPQSQYLLFPFDIQNPLATIDLGGTPMRPGLDQLPGVQCDYFTTQHWVDLTGPDFGVTIATPQNPMVQFGGFRFGEFAPTFLLKQPLLLGWITSNFWETNFNPVQPGQVSARYRILPHAGPLDPAAADRFGLDALHALPLLQHAGETQRVL